MSTFFRAAIVALLGLLSFGLPSQIFAIDNPLNVPNNRFGIHIVSEADLVDAANLVNANGDWGYVKFVVRIDELDREKWQGVFDQVRRLRLIPLVRIATRVEGKNWEKPKEEDARRWAEFLASLNWVVKNRYVIIFNEPNHATEWGGEVNPAEYVRILKNYSQELKNASEDFFILPAGLDASVPTNGKNSLDEASFIRKMLEAEPEIFDFIDGWTSHSYPNPDFSGHPEAVGRGTVRTFLWEKSLLKSLGVGKNLPIFISETGWSQANLSSQRIAQFYQAAYTVVWNHPEVVVVVPFILNYQDKPFNVFSFKRQDESGFYEQYLAIQNLTKEKGRPKQIHASFLIDALPTKLVQESSYVLPVVFRNTGQSIWSRNDSFDVSFAGSNVSLETREFPVVEPFTNGSIPVEIKTPRKGGEYEIKITLTKDGLPFGESIAQKITVVSPLKLSFRPKLWFGKLSDGQDFKLTVLDQNGTQLAEFAGLAVSGGVGFIPEIHNLVPGEEYSLILAKPYFLPAKVKAILSVGDNLLSFVRLFPFDFYPDGRLSLADLGEAILHPLQTVKLILPYEFSRPGNL